MTKGRAGKGALILLIDGYNVIAPTGSPPKGSDPRWLDRQRKLLIRRLIDHLPSSIRRRTCVVFDAVDPPRDRAHEFQVEGVEVRFAVGYPEADDLLEELIAAHSAAKRLMVVSSDHRVQTAANRRGSVALDSQPWLDDLLDGVIHLADGPQYSGDNEADQDAAPEKPTETCEDDVASWMKDFGFEE